MQALAKQRDIGPAADAVADDAAGDAAAEERDDDHGEIAAGAQHRQLPHLAQVGRQERGQGRVTAVGADAEQAADQGRAQHVALEDAARVVAKNVASSSAATARGGSFNAAADEDDEQRGQQPERKQHPPGDVRRVHR